MSRYQLARQAAIYFIVFLSLVTSGYAQKKGKAPEPPLSGRAIMWEPVDASSLDLYKGPGGDEMQPNLESVKFIKEEKRGNNKKFRISDANGRVWIAKLGSEAQPETAAVRLLYGLGYKTEVNYLIPTLNILGKGTFKNVRLEARPTDVKRAGEWKWRSNPFVGTKELQGLKIMMIFMTNWDLLDLQNVILHKEGENQYVVSDLGATFGKLGNNNLPIFFRLGRKTGSAKNYIKTRFVKGVERGQVKFAFKGKSRSLMRGITIADARWLSNLLNQLSEKQIRDIFRAANYSPADVDLFTQAVRRKIAELDRVVGSNLALN